MSIIINNEALRAIKADAFNEDALQEYILCIKVASQSLSLCAFQEEMNACHLFEAYHINATEKNPLPFAELKQIWNTTHFLSSSSWKKIIVIVADKKCTLVPEAFASESLSAYFRLNCEFDDKQEEIHQFHYSRLQLRVLFSVPKSLQEWLNDTYDNIPIRFIHSNACFLSGVSSLASFSNTDSLFLLIENARLTVLSLTQNKLRLLNSFECQSAEDILYYTLFTMNELGIAPKNVNVTCWGDVAEEDAAFRLLRDYVKGITLGKRPLSLRFPQDLDTVPKNLGFDLFNAYSLLQQI